MKDELAERLLTRVMEWEPAQLYKYGHDLQALASYKYDEYEGFRPGEKFLESLSRWLWQFGSKEERRLAIRFVLERLIFVSRAELEHAIELVYPDIIRPLVRRRVSAELGLAPHAVAKITGSKEFQALQRKLLVIGLADGARLDRLRRASPELSHEQFLLILDPADESINRMRHKLSKALQQRQLPEPAKFRHVLLIDDFTGSGFTLIRQEGSNWEGKLIKARAKIEDLKTLGALESDTGVTVVIYVASQRAEQYVKEQMKGAGLDWDFRVVQLLPEELRVTEEEMMALCERYYDPILNDEHKGKAVLGFRDSALPLVLSHNTPNNSIALLWGETADREDSEFRCHALFPRYERHRVDRP